MKARYMKLGDRITIPMKKFWQQHPRHRWILSILWVLLIGFLAFFWNLGSIGLIDETEPLFAEAARQMTVTGDWIVPFFNGKTRFDKPPLVYWLMAIGYKILGVNEWSVRLPSAIAALGLTALGFYTLRRFAFLRQIRLIEQKIPNYLWFSAWIGAALIALNPLTLVWARTGVSDMLLVGCMGSALLCFFIGYAGIREEERETRGWGDAGKQIDSYFSPWYVAFYVLSALAVLAKGPVGIVLPGLIIAAFLVYLGKFRLVVPQMRPLLGGLIFAAITIPWYILVIWKQGDAYINSFFGYHNLQRFTSVVNDHAAPWYFYFLIVLVGFAPWSGYLPLAIARLRFWDRKYWQAAPASTQLGLFALFWFAGVFGFFTIAVTKLPSYVLPLMPAAAIMVTLLWTEQMSFGAGEKVGIRNATYPMLQLGLWWSGLFNLVLVLAIASFIFLSPNLIGYDPAVPDLKQVLQQSGIPLRGGIIWGITATAVAFLLRKKQLQPWLWSANLLGFIAFLIFVLTPGYFLVDKVRQQPLRELAAIAVQQQKPGEELIMVGFEKPSVVFYTQKPVTFFPNFEFTIFHIQQLAATNPASPSVLILAQYNKTGEAFLQPGQYKIIGESGSYKLIRSSKKQFLPSLIK
ncbi:ArnT family glycosyltransferase [Microseira sp. BLCC-F43]|uniref:ArnT family glycosyltransferase n=1 Tax=Microseira sp. BLCC-F43 TaxID=3153602 RepID=UPI0035B8F4AA